MTLNFPGPYQLRIFYTVSLSSLVLEHMQSLNIALSPDPTPGDDFSTMQPVYPVGTTFTDLEDMLDTYIADMAACLGSASASINRVELWKYDPGTFDASFVGAKAYSQAGTSGSAGQAAAQSIVTMRTTLGGVFKYVIMESVIIPAVTDPGVIALAALEAIIASIESGEYPFLGRDGGWPFSRIAHYPGQN